MTFTVLIMSVVQVAVVKLGVTQAMALVFVIVLTIELVTRLAHVSQS